MYFSVALLEMTLKAKNMDSNRLDHQTKSISGHSFFFLLNLTTGRPGKPATCLIFFLNCVGGVWRDRNPPLPIILTFVLVHGLLGCALAAGRHT